MSEALIPVLVVEAPNSALVPRIVSEKTRLLSSRVVDGYHLGKKLGDGAYGNVHKAWIEATPVPSASRVNQAPQAAHDNLSSWRSDKSGEGRLRRRGSLVRSRSFSLRSSFAARRSTPKPPKTEVAIKVIKPSATRPNETSVNSVAREAALQALCHDHPGVACVLDFMKGRNDSFVVMEMARGGDLFTSVVNSQLARVGRVRMCLAHLASAVAHMHAKNIAHCDIKPENVLLREKGKLDSVMLCDFGHAVYWKDGDELLSKNVGTLRCMPPEMLVESEDGGRRYNPKALDVWALGIVAFFMLTCKFPFEGPTDKDTQHNIVFGKFQACLPLGVDGPFRRLLEGMLHPNPKSRLTIAEVLAHPVLRTCRTRSM